MSQEIISISDIGSDNANYGAAAAEENQNRLELALSDWLMAKAGRSGSAKTKTAYRDTITVFRAILQTLLQWLLLPIISPQQ